MAQGACHLQQKGASEMSTPSTFLDYWLITMTILFIIEFLFVLWYAGRDGKIIVLDREEFQK
jgi:hypothetical protein